MIAIRLRSEEDKRAAWRHEDRPSEVKKPAPVHNLRAVLELGSTVPFHFRGRAYGVPPLPWEAGEELLAEWLEVKEYNELTRENLQKYYRSIQRLAKLLWKYSYPLHLRPLYPIRWTGLLRLFKFLHGNPWRHATEAEIGKYTLFFLQCRTSTVDPLLSETTEKSLSPSPVT